MPEYRRTTAASLGSLTLVAALTGVTGVATSSATAAPTAETCQGQPATIVSSEERVSGTEGADVIVAGGPTAEVHGLGGDDVICVVGGLGHFTTVDAGPGDDVVDTTAATGGISLKVVLGAGADRLLGGPAHETVIADAAGSAEDDVIDTGAGHDYVDSGTDGFVNGDTVALGAGDGHVRLRATRFTGEVDGGAGVSELTVGDPQGSFEVDARTGQITRDGEAWEPLPVEFQRFQVPSSGGLVFQGSDRAESLSVGPFTNATRSVDMAGGDDVLNVSGAPGQGDVLDGGTGRDQVSVRAEGADLDVNLAAGTFDTTGLVTGPASAVIRGLEVVYLKGRELTVRGTEGDDHLSLTACETTVKAGAGADFIWVGPDEELDESSIRNCPDPTARLSGGTGDDTIHGSTGDDRLRGGPGDDEIRGYDGHDRIWGGSGDDEVRGGTGRDEIWGGHGRDKVKGNKGPDKLWGGKGGDTVKGGQGRDQLWGGKGPDTLVGNKGRDQLWGDRGHDVLRGGKSNDRLWGGRGIDRAQGGQGYDRCRAETRRGCER